MSQHAIGVSGCQFCWTNNYKQRQCIPAPCLPPEPSPKHGATSLSGLAGGGHGFSHGGHGFSHGGYGGRHFGNYGGYSGGYTSNVDVNVNVNTNCSQWSAPLNNVSQELLTAANTALTNNNLQPTTQSFSDGSIYLYSIENKQITIRRCANVGVSGLPVSNIGATSMTQPLWNPNKNSGPIGVGSFPASLDKKNRAFYTTPMQGSSAVYGMIGQAPTNIPLVAGATAVDPNNVAAGCTGGFSTPSRWPPAMTDQAVKINDSPLPANDYNILYQGTLYTFTKGSGNTTIQVCGGVNMAALTAPPPAPGPGTPGYVPPTTGGSVAASPWTMVAIGVGALALGVGAAYLIYKKPASPRQIAHEEYRRSYGRMGR